jgi:hypothetical protein
MVLVLESGLPEDAIQCSGGKIILRIPSNGNPTQFRRVFILPMATLLGDHDPTVVLNYTQNFSNSHVSALLGLLKATLVASGRTVGISGRRELTMISRKKLTTAAPLHPMVLAFLRPEIRARAQRSGARYRN